MKANTFKKSLALLVAVLMVVACMASMFTVSAQNEDILGSSIGSVLVDGETGTFQSASGALDSSYNLYYNADDEYLSIWVETNYAPITGKNASAGNGNDTTIRIWFGNEDPEQITYTYFADISYTGADSAPSLALKKNTVKDGNSATLASSEGIVVSSELTEENTWCAGITIPLSLVGGDAETPVLFYVCVANGKDPEAGIDNNALYYPAIELGESERLANFPYKKFVKENALTTIEPAQPEMSIEATVIGDVKPGSVNTLKLNFTIDDQDIDVTSLRFFVSYDPEIVTFATTGGRALDFDSTFPSSLDNVVTVENGTIDATFMDFNYAGVMNGEFEFTADFTISEDAEDGDIIDFGVSASGTTDDCMELAKFFYDYSYITYISIPADENQLWIAPRMEDTVEPGSVQTLDLVISRIPDAIKGKICSIVFKVEIEGADVKLSSGKEVAYTNTFDGAEVTATYENGVVNVLLANWDESKTACFEEGEALTLTFTVTAENGCCVDVNVKDVQVLTWDDLDNYKDGYGFDSSAYVQVKPYQAIINVDDKAILSDGKVDFTGDWGAVGTNDVVLISNPECKTRPMIVVLYKVFEEETTLESIDLSLYYNAGVMIGYPIEAIVAASNEPLNLVSEQVADYSQYLLLEDADISLGKYGTATTNIKFEEPVTAKSFAIALYVGSNEEILGDNPAEGKVNWEFIAVSEVAFNEYEEPVVQPNAKVIFVDTLPVLSDGKVDFAGAWGAVGTNDVALINNEKCKEAPMVAILVKAFDEATALESIDLTLYRDANVMIGYPAEDVVVVYTDDVEDKTTYKVAGNYKLAAADTSVGKTGTVTSNFEFEEPITAKYFMIVLGAGSNADVLGDNPADGKIFWEFIAPSEIVYNVYEEPIPPTGDFGFIALGVVAAIAAAGVVVIKKRK